MGIPIIETLQDFRSYVAGVHMRKDFEPPTAFAIGAVRLDECGQVVEAIFPKINRGENFGSAAAFADVTHHRCGNAVRELGFFEFKELEQLFSPFIADIEEHPNVSACFQVFQLMCSPHNMKPVVVFVGDMETVDVSHHPVLAAFMQQLEVTLVH